MDESRYRLLVDSVTDYAIYMLDADGIVSSWNSGAHRFKGYTEAEIVGQHFSRFYVDEDREVGLPQKALATAVREGRFEGEGWRLRKDGTRFWAHVVIDPIRSPGTDDLLGFAKITRDLSERKAAAELLKRSEDQFNLLVQSVTDYAIYMLDAQGRVSSWNLGAQRIKGYAPEEIIGVHFSRFYTAEDRARDRPAITLQTAAREGRFEGEGWRVRKDGTRFWANVVVDRINGPEGQLLGFAKVTRDVTEKREAQHQLEIAREAFFQSQKMDAIGQLTGGVAHDFNNLLMAVLASLALIRKRIPEDPKTQALLDNAVRGAKRGAELTQRMLAFARRQQLKPAAVNVPELVEGMAGLLQSSLGPGVGIETRFAEGLSPVLVDANQLELALLNLAVNSRDAMPHGGVITIAAREDVAPPGKARPSAQRYVRLSLQDQGEGMDEETLARATEPFYTTKGVGKGTGLGLSMVEGLAAQSGGWLELKSAKGQGTTAELWLPVAPAASEVPPPAQAAPPSLPAASTGPLTVLAVDDDALVLMNTVAMLQELGHTVREAPSAKEALAMLARDGSIDLLVTDQAMPQMTGAQLIEAARLVKPGLPAILATGYADLSTSLPPDVPRLAKPFDLDALSHTIVSAAGGG
ncbi:PAS domain-containing sensor histidine kinase [Piscinibacter sp. HJYY11]|uniref:hybrid sensor histidine kinase/response regulator n=1 Tax=Piscinibacter sp. HJYY11 TaxID=2801333 RepID=UPI00191E3AF5|nr:PAS domain-containing sensor histidine kinase [Piscinibacter sp. HJYY11]MBL0727154.1 PAS domain S-box protein [Piscinibacter sp. HJYY11]